MELGKTNCKSVCFSFLARFGIFVGHPMGRVFVPLWRNGPQKGMVSPAWGPEPAKVDVSPCLWPLALQTYRFLIESGA